VLDKFSRVLTSIILITLIAFSLRMMFLVHEARLAPSEALAVVPFQNEAGNIAFSLSQGNGFCCLFRESTGPTAWLAPVYPLLLATIFKIFGAFTVRAFYAAAVLNCIFSGLVCIPLFYLAKRIAGLFPAAIAAWVWALLPSGIIIPFEWVWDTSLSALLAVTILWATLRLAESSRLADAAWYGLLWGFSLLTNPALGSAFPFLLGWMAIRQYRTRTLHLAVPILSLAMAVVCCIPWIIHNYIKFQRIIPLRSNFSFELWLGNNEIFDEHSSGINRITRFEEVHRYNQLGESAFLDEKSQQARSFIQQHPALFLKLTSRRIIATWLGTENPLHDFLHADSFFVRYIFLCNALLLLGLLVGSFRLAINRSPFLFPLVVFPLIFPLVYYVTHTSLRYRHPLDPVMALFVALAIGLPRQL
jgi:4-amino-4-deoxy-L-arabinose transferase-like glycosyltransferase